MALLLIFFSLFEGSKITANRVNCFKLNGRIIYREAHLSSISQWDDYRDDFITREWLNKFFFRRHVSNYLPKRRNSFFFERSFDRKISNAQTYNEKVLVFLLLYGLFKKKNSCHRCLYILLVEISILLSRDYDPGRSGMRKIF